MKIGHANKIGEQETLNSFLVSYRDTPHISTGISPGATIFRDGYKTDFPGKKVSQKARWRDINSKMNVKITIIQQDI